jgi:tetratricopeptide (TPR) repeat protein
MSSSSFTADVDRRPAPAPPRTDQGPGRWTVAITAILLCAWSALMSFGVVSLCRPAWLERAGQLGLDAESRLFVKHGDSMMRQKQYRAALELYARALQMKPKTPVTMANMAAAYIQLGDFQSAAGILNELRQMDLRPGLRSTVFASLSVVAEQQKRINEAIACGEQAREGAIEPEKVCRRLGSLYLAIGRFAEARAVLEQAAATQVDPTSLYRKMLASLVEDESAEADAAAAAQQHLAAGVRIEDLQPYALDLYRETLYRDPEVSRTHTLLGAVCGQLGDYAAARQHLEAAIHIWPQNPEARKNLELLQRVAPH